MKPSAEIETLVRIALAEDIGAGDVTTALCVDDNLHAIGSFYARQSMVISGIDILTLLYDSCDLRVADGAHAQTGDCIAIVQGPARSLLTHERVSLNFLQHLCGIATYAARYVDAVEGTGCKILDTRKTTPGFRALEKAAAAAGGVQNHRMGLYDKVLIKNNHIVAAGGVRQALERVRGTSLPIEIEVRTRAELDEALAAGAAHVLFDNLLPAEAREWVHHVSGRATVELSGGITLETVRAYAETGADYISIGALTHSAPAVDINFRLTLG